VRKLSTFRSEY